MKNPSANSVAVVVACALFAGCASVPQETPITVNIAAQVPAVQFKLEDLIRTQAPHSEVKTQNSTMLIMSNDCVTLPTMDAFKCSVVMMGIGNTGWTGPFHVQTYRFAEIDGKTSVRGGWNWCAVNGFGKENCTAINPAGVNAYLRKLDESFAAQAALSDQPLK